MIELIQQNKFPELKEALKNSDELQIHEYLYDILNGNALEIDDESFSPYSYQIEFLEGLQLYKALEKSEIQAEYLKQFSNLLVQLAFMMSAHVQMLSDKAMNNSAYLTDLGHIYRFKVYPEIRDGIQEFIDLLKIKLEEDKAIANLTAAKAKISNSIGNILEKYEIGEDMLQFAEHFEKVGETEIAIRIHQGIMNDFECESVKLSSGIIPEASHIDDRPEAEIEIFEKAKNHFERLTGQKIQEPNRIHIKENIDAKNLADSTTIQSQSQTQKQSFSEQNTTSQSSKPGLLDRIKKMFGNN
jgi:hypothetical protein